MNLIVIDRIASLWNLQPVKQIDISACMYIKLER
jgi:hypothetical protein